MYSCGYNFRLPLRGVGPTGRRLDLEKTISFSDSLLPMLDFLIKTCPTSPKIAEMIC